MWFAQKFSSPDSIFNLAESIEIHGPIDPALFEMALAASRDGSGNRSSAVHRAERWASTDDFPRIGCNLSIYRCQCRAGSADGGEKLDDGRADPTGRSADGAALGLRIVQGRVRTAIFGTIAAITSSWTVLRAGSSPGALPRSTPRLPRDARPKRERSIPWRCSWKKRPRIEAPNDLNATAVLAEALRRLAGRAQSRRSTTAKCWRIAPADDSSLF